MNCLLPSPYYGLFSSVELTPSVGLSGLLYGNILLRASCRFLQPPQGLIPIAEVTLAMLSPSPREGSFLSTGGGINPHGLLPLSGGHSSGAPTLSRNNFPLSLSRQVLQ